MPQPSRSAQTHTDLIETRWNEIPHHALGTVPEELPDTNPLLYRRMIAKRAIMAAYEDSDVPESCIVDLLADLRHLCDALGLDFGAEDRAAFLGYATERARHTDLARKHPHAKPAAP